MEELLQKISNGVYDFNVNATALIDRGNKAAGARSRKASLELTKLFKEWREISVGK